MIESPSVTTAAARSVAHTSTSERKYQNVGVPHRLDIRLRGEIARTGDIACMLRPEMHRGSRSAVRQVETHREFREGRNIDCDGIAQDRHPRSRLFTDQAAMRQERCLFQVCSGWR